MKKHFWLCLTTAMVLTLAVEARATKQERAKLITDFWQFKSKAAVDTIFFDDFETDTMGWSVMDIAVQEPYWNINAYCPVGPYAGHHWWCGTNKFAGIWANSPGYGNGWVQMLYSPDIDLSMIISDSVQLRFYHYFNVEAPSGGSDWDCVNLWLSTDGGNEWQILRPDTFRSEGGSSSDYNLRNSYAWHYTGLVPDWIPIPGWGGTNNSWSMVVFDLTPFRGQVIKLRFAVVSDPMESDENGGPYHGAWYLDNISVDTLSNGGSRASIFFDDCESGNIGWTPGSKTPAIHWHKTDYRSYSSGWSWYAGDESTRRYSWGYSDALVSPLIDLRPVQTTVPCRVDFMFWADMPDTGGDANGIFDNYSVDISADSGHSWQGVTPYVYVVYPSVSQQWQSHQAVMGYLDISQYVGQVVKLRIPISTDGDSNVGEGLYLDNFLVTGKTREPLPPPATVLLVDNDGDAVDLSDESWTKHIENSLAANGYRYSNVIIGTHREMYPGYMEKFPAVIWNLGGNFDGRLPDYQAISQRNQQLLMEYLDHGGRLWIVGQKYLGFSNPDTTIHPNLWRDYIHLSPENGWFSSETFKIYGLEGDTIGHGFIDTLLYDYLNGGSIGWTYSWMAYSLKPDTPDYPVKGFIKADDGTFVGLRYYDASAYYKFIKTTFPFEALSSWQGRDSLLAKMVNWLLDEEYDNQPPQVPQGLTVRQEINRIICYWHPVGDSDLAGYRVYRAIESGLPGWDLLGETAAMDTTFIDSLIAEDIVYVYAITSFDSARPANESQKSRWAFIRSQPWKDNLGSSDPVQSNRYQFYLMQNTPNPVQERTTISLSIPEPCRLNLKIYNITGQLVDNISPGIKDAGLHHIVWWTVVHDGIRVAKGCYLYRLEAVSLDGSRRYIDTKIMVVM